MRRAIGRRPSPEERPADRWPRPGRAFLIIVAAKTPGYPTITRFRSTRQRQLGLLGVMALAACAAPLSASAQAEGGLYVAGAGFGFEEAVAGGLSRNPDGQRFFLLALLPQTEALTTRASPSQAAARQRAINGNGVLLVCRRDIDNGSLDPSSLVPGVVRVRGWPPAGSSDLPAGQRYFADEDAANPPQSGEMLRRLRSSCS